MSVSIPAPFTGTEAERSANLASHVYGGGDRCMDCDSRLGSESANYRCGSSVPRVLMSTAADATLRFTGRPRMSRERISIGNAGRVEVGDFIDGEEITDVRGEGRIYFVTDTGSHGPFRFHEFVNVERDVLIPAN